jgi:hypothetical protein
MPGEVLRKLVLSAIKAYNPSHVRVVHIRGWFGPRWLGFAGKSLGAIGGHSSSSVVPAFNPRRVATEYDLLVPEGVGPQPSLHGWRTSEANLRHEMKGMAPNGTLAEWLSVRDETRETRKDDDRQCLMVYSIGSAPSAVAVMPIRWYVQSIGQDDAKLEPDGIGWEELRWIQGHTREEDAVCRAFMARF